MLAVPSGMFGLAGKLLNNVPYDVWALGSDIWKIKTVPVVGKMVLRCVLRNAEHVFADGQRLCDEVTSLAGVPCLFLQSSRKLPPVTKEPTLAGEADRVRFLYVGRYHVNKGPDLLIKAVAELSKIEKEKIHVNMFGIGPMFADLQKMIVEYELSEFIDLHGPIHAQEFSNQLSGASYLVIPSRIESIPVVFSDAMQGGTPVVVMPVGDLASLVDIYKCGIVAESVSAPAMASALRKAIYSNAEVFQCGVRDAYGQFDIAKSAERWLSLCNKIQQTHQEWDASDC
jgi:glycosyltransferase involved in cell wall biosynthesis